MIDNVEGFGLIAIDKAGGRILFLNPATLEIDSVLDELPPKPHELLILARQHKAYVPIFGDGVHGDNPNPGTHIAVINLQTRSVHKLIDISPQAGPHTACLGADGMIYCCCETTQHIVIIDPNHDRVSGTIRVDSPNVHRLTAVPGRNQVITESEEDGTLSQIEVNQRAGRVLNTLATPGPLNGIDAAPTRPWVVTTHRNAPELFIVDRDRLMLIDTLRLPGHTRAAQITRYRPDGEILAVIGHFDPVTSFYDADLNHLFTASVQNKPLDGAFTPDGRVFLVANENSGSISVIDLVAKQTREHIDVPVGCEVLGYFPLL